MGYETKKHVPLKIYIYSFMKVGNSPKEAETHQGSWRQAILNSVVTPSKTLDSEAPTEFLSPMRKRETNLQQYSLFNLVLKIFCSCQSWQARGGRAARAVAHGY